MKKKKTEKPKFVVTRQVDVAKFFEVNTRTVQRWMDDGMPHAKGKYDLQKITVWKLDQEKKNAKDPNREKWDVDLKESKARLARLEYDIKVGELLKKQDVERQWIDIGMAFKQELSGLASRVAPQVVGREISKGKEIIEQRVDEIFDNLAALARRDDFKVQKPLKKKKGRKRNGKNI